MLTFVLPGPVTTRTGGFIYDRRIIEGLRARGHEVKVIELEGEFPFPSDDAKASALRQLSKLRAGDTIVIDGLALGSLPEVAQEIGVQRRLVGLLHHPLALETGLTNEQRQRMEKRERAALSHVERVIVSSCMTARTLLRGEWTKTPVTVVEPGTDPAPVAAGSDGEGLELLCVATLIPRKGHVILFEALAGLTDIDWRLNCVGASRDPQTAAALETKLATLGLTGRVRLLGELEGRALDELFGRSDVFVLPSFYEGFGMVITEAVMRALPIVTTTGGALSETLPAGCGLLSAPGDVKSLRENLRAVLSKPGERQKLREAALSARQKLTSWPQAAEAFAEALELE